MIENVCAFRTGNLFTLTLRFQNEMQSCDRSSHGSIVKYKTLELFLLYQAGCNILFLNLKAFY